MNQRRPNKQMQPTKRDGCLSCPAPRASLAQPRFAADLQRSVDFPVSARGAGEVRTGPPNKAMKLAKLPPASWPVGGAVGCPHRPMSDARTASQLVPGVGGPWAACRAHDQR